MAELVRKVRIFLASPGDVAAERKAVARVVDDLNVGFASARDTVLELVRWETHVWPGFGEDAQSVINQRIGAYDIFIGVLWNRIGTSTNRSLSGTVEEIERAHSLWQTHRRPAIMLYFRRSPADLSTIEELDQKRGVLDFRNSLQRLGALVREYSDLDEFGRLVSLHIIQELTHMERSEQVAELGKRVDKQGRTIEEQARALSKQQYVISQLVTYSMAEYIFKHLQHVYHGKRRDEGWPSNYLYNKDPPFERDLRFLRDHGFVGFTEIGRLPAGVDLVQALELTPVGTMCVELREGMLSPLVGRIAPNV
jgi:hypothetical protein